MSERKDQASRMQPLAVIPRLRHGSRLNALSGAAS